MTARPQTERDCLGSLGAAGVIPKPLDPMTLATSVRRYVRPAVDDPLEAVRKSFRRRLAEDAAKLAEHRSALTDKKASPGALAEMRRIAHGLAGAGGIFGFPEISEAAAALEEAAIVERHDPDATKAIVIALDRLLACSVTTSLSTHETAPIAAAHLYRISC